MQLMFYLSTSLFYHVLPTGFLCRSTVSLQICLNGRSFTYFLKRKYEKMRNPLIWVLVACNGVVLQLMEYNTGSRLGWNWSGCFVVTQPPLVPTVSPLTYYTNGALWSALIVACLRERFVIVKRHCLINGETSK